MLLRMEARVYDKRCTSSAQYANMPPLFWWLVRNCFPDHNTDLPPKRMTSDNKHTFFPHNSMMKIKIGGTKKAEHLQRCSRLVLIFFQKIDLVICVLEHNAYIPARNYSSCNAKAAAMSVINSEIDSPSDRDTDLLQRQFLSGSRRDFFNGMLAGCLDKINFTLIFTQKLMCSSWI